MLKSIERTSTLPEAIAEAELMSSQHMATARVYRREGYAAYLIYVPAPSEIIGHFSRWIYVGCASNGVWHYP